MHDLTNVLVSKVSDAKYTKVTSIMIKVYNYTDVLSKYLGQSRNSIRPQNFPMLWQYSDIRRDRRRSIETLLTDQGSYLVACPFAEHFDYDVLSIMDPPIPVHVMLNIRSDEN